MAATKLKKALGTDGQALTDESFGADGLKAVLQAMAKSAGYMLRGAQAGTIATATLDEIIAPQAMDVLIRLEARVAVCGTAGSTVLQVQKNGTLITGATLTFDNADADPTQLNTSVLAVSLAAGDRLTLAVTTAPTAGTGLSASCKVALLEVE